MSWINWVVIICSVVAIVCFLIAKEYGGAVWALNAAFWCFMEGIK